MSVDKIAVSIDHELVQKLDKLVADKKFKNRSHAIQSSIQNTVTKLEHQRLAQQCRKLNEIEEQRLADEGLEEDLGQWPKF